MMYFESPNSLFLYIYEFPASKSTSRNIEPGDRSINSIVLYAVLVQDMASKLSVFPILLPLALVLLVLSGSADAQDLTVGYYSKTCPNAEAIIFSELSKIIKLAPSLAGPLLRMHFHDCFVRGCDGSILLNSTKEMTAERDAPPNDTLRGYGVIDRVKAKLEEACPGTVSCADILAFAARDVVVLSGGPSWPVWAGRKDGRISNDSETDDLPPPTVGIKELIQMFSKKGLSIKDLVVLSGGHTIGMSHCSSIDDRLHNYTGKGTPDDVDPTLERHYLLKLRTICKPNDLSTIVEMDPGSFKTFDTGYYKQVSKRRGLFHADEALLAHPLTKSYVLGHAGAYGESEFFKDFADSMINMGNIEVLTGAAGEVRKKCYLVN